MRLPIYRHLSQRLELYGFSLWEILGLSFGFLFLSEILANFRYGTSLVFVLTIVTAWLLRHLHQRFEKNFVKKVIRYVELPDGLYRKTVFRHPRVLKRVKDDEL